VKVEASRPLVSVGLAVHDGERYLAAALDCLVGQTWRHLEILVGDNASTDRTREICLRYAERDPRIRYLRSERNRGAAWNFNRLTEHARGRYFRWAAADDLIGVECVERSVEVLEARPDVVLVYPKTLLVDEEGTPIDTYEDDLHLEQERPSERFLQVHRRLGLCNAFYGTIRLSELRRTGLLRPCPAPDMVLLPELALYGKFVELPERLFHRRFHEEAASAKTGVELAAHYGGDEAGAGKVAARDASPPWPPFYLHRCRRIGPNLGAVLRSPVPAGEKARAVAGYLRGLVRARDDLAAELADAARWRWDRARWRLQGGAREERVGGAERPAGPRPRREVTREEGGRVGSAPDA
jgi:hypothetical protein